jgi:hypothetical protein
MHGSRSKIPSKKSRQAPRAEGFNSGVKGLKKTASGETKTIKTNKNFHDNYKPTAAQGSVE